MPYVEDLGHSRGILFRNVSYAVSKEMSEHFYLLYLFKVFAWARDVLEAVPVMTSQRPSTMLFLGGQNPHFQVKKCQISTNKTYQHESELVLTEGFAGKNTSKHLKQKLAQACQRLYLADSSARVMCVCRAFGFRTKLTVCSKLLFRCEDVHEDVQQRSMTCIYGSGGATSSNVA